MIEGRPTGQRHGLFEVGHGLVGRFDCASAHNPRRCRANT